MPKFNPRQLEAIRDRGNNLLVSAAAGSGKTMVLVERILGLLQEGVDPASLLVVTFTQAAAAEMRDRLRTRLEQLAEKDDQMASVLDRLSLATISTIHAFCKQLLDKHFDQAGLEAGFQVMDEEKSDRLKSLAMDNTLDELYLDDELTEKLAAIGGMDQLRLEIFQLYEFLMSQPNPWEWLQRALEDYAKWSKNQDGSPWREELIRTGLQRMQEVRQRAIQTLKLCEAEESGYTATVQGDVETLGQALEPPFPSPVFQRLPSIKKQNKKPADDEIKAQRDAYKKQAQLSMDLLRETDALDKERLYAMLIPLQALQKAVRRFADMYEAIKAEEGVVDFSDLEQLSLRLLQDQRICLDVRDKYRYVFVDEYQDSSTVQEAILSRVAGKNNRFLVGDVKQSIYRFRQADPSIFLQHYEEFGRNDGGKLINLNRNFRSNAGVLEAVNLVFERCMQGGDAEISYDEEAKLYPGIEKGDIHPARLSLVTMESAEEDEEDIKKTEAEALNAARLIHECLGMPVRDQEGLRPAQFRDMVILLRSPKGLVRVFQETLASQGIPVYAEAGGSYFDTWEVRAALDYLTALDNPRKDVPLLGAMRGLGGFEPEEMARIRLMGRELSWYSCLKLYVQRGEDPALREKTAGFVDRLWEHRRLSRTSRVSETLRSVLEDWGFVQRCLGLPYGRTRQANLQALCLRAAAFDGPSDGLNDFLRQSSLAARRGRDGDTPTLTEKDNVVRIMSVHKSKGLEFPIVIGCGLARKFNLRNEKDDETGATSTLYLDGEMGLGIGFFDPNERVKADTLACMAIREKKRRQSIAEEMRVLYVLMTRPKDYLLLSAVVDSAEKKAMEWNLPSGQAKCPLDWIGSSMMTHADGEALRDLVHTPPNLQAHASKWQLELKDAGELMRENKGDGDKELDQILETLQAAKAAAQNPFAQALQEEDEQSYPKKQSVLQSIHWGEKDVDFIHTRPQFMQRQQQRMTPAERGSAVHEAMRLLNLKDLAQMQGEALCAAVSEQIHILVEQGRLTKRQTENIDEGQLHTFFQSEIGQCLLQSEKVLREQPFVRRREDGSLVQGIIDLCFETPKGWVLVDYKTDRRGLDADSVRGRHGPQVESYALAMEGAGLRVATKAVYLFAIGRAIYL